MLLVGTRELGIWHMSCIIGRRPVLCLPLEAQVPVHLNTFLQWVECPIHDLAWARHSGQQWWWWLIPMWSCWTVKWELEDHDHGKKKDQTNLEFATKTTTRPLPNWRCQCYTHPTFHRDWEGVPKTMYNTDNSPNKAQDHAAQRTLAVGVNLINIINNLSLMIVPRNNSTSGNKNKNRNVAHAVTSTHYTCLTIHWYSSSVCSPAGSSQSTMSPQPLIKQESRNLELTNGNKVFVFGCNQCWYSCCSKLDAYGGGSACDCIM